MFPVFQVTIFKFQVFPVPQFKISVLEEFHEKFQHISSMSCISNMFWSPCNDTVQESAT